VPQAKFRWASASPHEGCPLRRAPLFAVRWTSDSSRRVLGTISRPWPSIPPPLSP